MTEQACSATVTMPREAANYNPIRVECAYLAEGAHDHLGLTPEGLPVRWSNIDDWSIELPPTVVENITAPSPYYRYSVVRIHERNPIETFVAGELHYAGRSRTGKWSTSLFGADHYLFDLETARAVVARLEEGQNEDLAAAGTWAATSDGERMLRP